MLVERLTKQYLEKTSDIELKQFRDRANQLYKGLTNRDRTEKQLATVITKYGIIINEIEKRGLDIKWTGPLDRLRFKRSILGIDISPMKPITIKEGFISLSGTYAENYKTHNGPIDIVIKTNNVNVIKDLEPKITDYIHAAIPMPITKHNEEELNITNNLDSSGTEIPVFDLVLSPVENPTRIEIEVSKKKEYNPADIFVVPKVKSLSKTKKDFIEFTKKDSAKHLVGGIVYRSVDENATEKEIEDVLDSDYEFVEREDLEKAAYNWMIDTQRFLHQHNISGGKQPVHVVENWVTDVDTVKEGNKIPANSWFLVCWVDVGTEQGKELWKMIESGEISGFSLGGKAIAEEVE